VVLEGDMAGNKELDLGTRGGAAHHLEPGTDPIRSFPHSRKSPMPIPPRVQNARVNPTTIVPHQNAEPLGRIFDFHLDGLSVCMAERIHQRFPPNSIHLVPKYRVQGLSLTFNNYTKVDFVTSMLPGNKLLLDTRKGVFEIERVTLRRPQAANGVPSFLDRLPHQFQGSGQRRFYPGIVGQTVSRNMHFAWKH
jgi:hypothetical protein